MNYFLDTNICIYFLKGLYPKLQKNMSNRAPNQIKIPSIVKAELLYGVEKSLNKKENMENVLKFLFPFEIISFDDNASIQYGKIRSVLELKGTLVGPNDLIIASIVKSNTGTLITNNIKEFKYIKGLKINNWIH